MLQVCATLGLHACALQVASSERPAWVLLPTDLDSPDLKVAVPEHVSTAAEMWVPNLPPSISQQFWISSNICHPLESKTHAYVGNGPLPFISIHVLISFKIILNFIYVFCSYIISSPCPPQIHALFCFIPYIKYILYCVYRYIMSELDVVAQAFNASTREA